MNKYTTKINMNECLVLEGSFGDLIAVKTKSETKKEMIKEIQTNQGSWMGKFPHLYDTDKKIDMVIVVYRRVCYLKRQDLDNIAKVVLDALKGCLFEDESQIARLLLLKNDFFTKNRVKTALRVGLAIYFFVNEWLRRVTCRYNIYTIKKEAELLAGYDTDFSHIF